MKSLTKVTVMVLCFVAVLASIWVGCSDSKLSTTEPTVSGAYGDNVNAIPSDSIVIDPDFQNPSFSFDDSKTVTTCYWQKILSSEGDTVSINVDGYNRTIIFPADFLGSNADVSVTARKGINENGDNLEIFDLMPASVGISGYFELHMETGLQVPGESPGNLNFLLYRAVGGKGGLYAEIANQIPDENGVLRFQLCCSNSFAVISEPHQIEENFDIK